MAQRNLISSAAALVAIVVGVRAIALAQPRALEPGYTGQYLYRNDNFRTGQNLAESTLTPSTVNPAQFGLLFADSIDGYAYAQPLYAPAVNISGQGTHNVVFVATENDSVYAFDADAAGPPLWQTSFIDPDNGITAVPSSDLGDGCGDLTPIIGITATPVIDSTTGTLYVVSKVKLGPGSYQQQLHALDITTGLERKPESPMTIAASVPGSASDGTSGVVTFDPFLQMDRPALTLANGVVYLTFASHCDIQPYHGWILGYDETSLAQVVVYNTTPNGSQAGIWGAGCGPGVDTNGDLITVTGNGTFDTGGSPLDYGDSFLRLTPALGTPGTLTVNTFFTPLNELMLDDEDLDMGSGGNLLLPDQPGPNPHLMIGVGKVGTIYLVNRDSMGGFNGSKDMMVQALQHVVGGMFSTPAYWQGTVPKRGVQNMIYTIGVGDVPKMWMLSKGKIKLTPASSASNLAFGYPGASPVISANAKTGGVLWAINSSLWKSSGPAVLYAFDASDLKTELYNSGQNVADNPGPAVKFTNPTVANGSVYMGTQTQLAVFGLLPNTRGSLSINPPLLAFGQNVKVGTRSQPKKVTITNPAAKHGVPVQVETESSSSSAFVVKSECVKTLQPGKSCKVSVIFAPTDTTPAAGTLMITDDLSSSPQSVGLAGTGRAGKQ